MKYNISPVRVKIYDKQDASILDVQIANDNGSSCTFAYNLLATVTIESPRPRAGTTRTQGLGGDVISISGDTYTAYKNADDRLRFAANYIANNTTPNLIIL